MAIKTTKARALNNAIVSKVDSILENAEYPTSVKITIQSKCGEAPYITYQIEEFIVAEDSEDK